MVVKPFAERDNTTDVVGHPVQLIIDMHSTEVMNNSKGMLLMDMHDEADFIEDPAMEKPDSYRI